MFVTCSVFGADPEPRKTPVETKATATISLTITPAAAPVPALKYRFFVRPLDKEPGNAAPLYLKASLLLAEGGPNHKNWEAADTWFEMPIKDLPIDKMRDFLKSYEGVLKEARSAARREECHWELDIRNGFYEVLLPEVAHIRKLGRLLALKARLQMAEKDFDGALDSIQTGMVIGRHIAEQPTLISGLVGMAISANMLEQVRTLAQLPNGPNVYWALTALPTPYINLQRAYEMEGDGLFYEFPQLKKLQHLELSKEEWESRLRAFLAKHGKVTQVLGQNEKDTMEKISDVLGETALIALGLPKAKKWMIESGETAEAVQKKSAAEIILKYTAFVYEDLRDDMFRYVYLPAAETIPLMDAAEQRLKTTGDREIIPLARLLLPAVKSVQVSAARTDRQFAAARCVEALRIYAAGHDRKLPEHLTDIKEVPIPNDPVTGKPFEYRLEKDVAELVGPPLDGKSWNNRQGLCYEIRIAK